MGTMQEDFYPAAEKILADIENILKKHEYLQSFEIVFSNDNNNKSPVYHEANSLGLASWCVQPLYCYTHNRIMELRNNKLRRENPEIISRWLLGAILLNPDATTFWNMRRELVKNKRLDAQQELQFTKIVLHRKAKCFEAFSYRRLLIQHILTEAQYSNVNFESLLLEEIDIATVTANRHPNNYHAWNYRQFILLTYKNIIPIRLGSFLISEWKFSEKWCKQHVSDYGGLSYRQFLLKNFFLETEWMKFEISDISDQINPRLEIISSYINLNTKKYEHPYSHKEWSHNILNMLHGTDTDRHPDINYEQVLILLSYWIEDCILNQNLIKSFPGHESLWNHRRFLAYSLRFLTMSYLKYSCYKPDFFESLYYPKLQKHQNISINQEYSKSLIEGIFEKNSAEILSVKHPDCYQRILNDNFQKFLTSINVSFSK